MESVFDFKGLSGHFMTQLTNNFNSFVQQINSLIFQMFVSKFAKIDFFNRGLEMCSITLDRFIDSDYLKNIYFFMPKILMTSQA